jgi:ribose transport system permease protein
MDAMQRAQQEKPAGGERGDASPRRAVSTWRYLSNSMGMLPVLLLICILFAILSPRFLSGGNLMNIVRQGSVNIVLATGMTFIILTAGIDLSVGAILGCTAVVAMLVSLQPNLAWAAVPAALLAGLVMGLINGSLVAYVGLTPFIVTLGAYTYLRGAAYLLANGTTVINNNLIFAWIGNKDLGHVPWLVIIALIVLVLSWFLLRRTVLGVHIYATGGNVQAARLTGIKVKSVLLFVYAVSGLLAGLAGVMSASRLYSANGILGTGYELDAIAAVILGGTSLFGGVGTVVGSLIGALIIATLNDGLTLMNVSFFWQLVVRGVVIIVAVTIDLFRNRATARA